eukprot:comp11566_c0_seq1/m.6040 comp11566_c0_seq1/g.6040  ORF comp11566_c0_seq1/g.6040 comp11566_c0_seq1/m.6040 type:complete len:167 (-) comp11566_c0_seq1:551-1051(-)
MLPKLTYTLGSSARSQMLVVSRRLYANGVGEPPRSNGGGSSNLSGLLIFGMFGLGVYYMKQHEEHQKFMEKKGEEIQAVKREVAECKAEIRAYQEVLRPGGTLMTRFIERVESNPTVKAKRTLVWEDIQRELKTAAFELYVDIVDSRSARTTEQSATPVTPPPPPA